MNIDKIDRSQDWQGVFDQIDANFQKVIEYISSIGNRVKVERFVAAAGQTKFTLSDSYNGNRNCLAVYRNGLRLVITEDFTETDSRSFELVKPSEAKDEIVAVYNRYYLIGDNTPTTGVLLQSPGGYFFRIEVDDYGNLTTTPVNLQ